MNARKSKATAHTYIHTYIESAYRVTPAHACLGGGWPDLEQALKHGRHFGVWHSKNSTI